MQIRQVAAAMLAAMALLGADAKADWVYSRSDDRMTGKPTFYAIVESVNQLQLEFPYSGRNYAKLMVRESARHGTDVIFQIDRGQLLCHYPSCSVLVRFDEGQPMQFNALRSADSDPTVLFIEGSKRFIGAARKAKTIRIAATVYQSGEPVMEFSTPSMLSWPQKR